MRTLVETGELQGDRGSYRLAVTLVNIEVPTTVQAILAARIDRLAPEDKRLLQAAAVIGKDVPYPLLQAIAELPEQRLREVLTDLQSAEFLYEASLFPDLEYTFKHALTHEVAYGSLLQERRRALHARIVEAIEARYPGRLDEHVEHLGHHALRGELWDRAAAFLRQAGEKAATRSANHEAIVYFEQALSALAHLPERKENIEPAIDLRFRVRICLTQLGDFAPILQRLREAEALARAIGDERRLGWVHSYLCQYYTAAATPDNAVAAGKLALDIAESLEDFALRVATRFFLGLAYRGLGAHEDARALLSKNVSALPGDLEREHFGLAGPAAAWSRNVLVWCLAEVGEFAEGIAQGEEALRISRDTNHSYALAGGHVNLGYLYVCQGELRIAIDYLERGLDISGSRDVPFMSLQLRAILGYAYTLCDRLPEAEALLPQAVTEAGDRGMTLNYSLFLGWLAEMHLYSHRVEDARREATRALYLTRKRKEEGSQAWALRLLGEVQARAAETAPEAERYYREALSLAESRHMRPLVAHCHFGLGKLHAKTGQREEAREYLATATTLYREMDMQFWLEQAEVETRELA